ncbi:MAG: hypothetical protein PHH90_06185 [Limnochordia bacterium]|nr:hypothetical protein [Limnochordia bacterium]
MADEDKRSLIVSIAGIGGYADPAIGQMPTAWRIFLSEESDP